MSNKVLTILKSTVVERAEENPKEVFLDISMVSSPTSYPPGTKYENRGKWKIERLANVNAIRNSLYNIFTWIPGERILNPEFGSNLRRLLYEGITSDNIEKIGAEIRYSVQKWEPRINIDGIQNITSTNDAENNTVHLRIIYSIPSLTDEQFAYEYEQPITTR